MISEFLNQGRNSPAIIHACSGRIISYQELEQRVSTTAEMLVSENPRRDLAFLYATNTIDSIVLYLASLHADIPLCLVEPKVPNLQSLAGVYTPRLILTPGEVITPEGYQQKVQVCESDYVVLTPENAECHIDAPHPDLSLLLQTSGTTGNPKLVRLTKSNIIANASSISEYLGLGPDEISVQGLPMHYSYGLSLINSHLYSGGSIVLTKHSFMMADFWKDFDRHACTSFAGIPFMYETLHRLQFDPAKRPTLRTMTQAGGGLRPDLIQHFHDRARDAGIRFFVMYGQTEATARISYVPWERLGEKIGSIGTPIPRGRLSLKPLNGSDDMHELVYEGPNVMMGYAEDRTALPQGDILNGVLHTGDLARFDDDGFFYLTGRLKRFAKLFGRRVNLGDIESLVEGTFGVQAAAIEGKNRLVIFVAASDEKNVGAIRRRAAEFLGTTLSAILVEWIPEIPRTQAGKKDYKMLSL